MMNHDPRIISRTDAAMLAYESGEILDSARAVQRRSEAIHKATYLGNLKHQKVHIQLNTGADILQVHTTIWLHYNNHIYLKGNIKVPVERILGIHF